MNKYFKLVNILDRKTQLQVLSLFALCCVVGILDFYTVLVSARLNFDSFDPEVALSIALFFGAATFFRVCFLFANAYVCAKISSTASLFFVKEYIERSSTIGEAEASPIASDVLAKTANLTTFVINPIFHFLIAVISLFGVIGSLIYSFPELMLLFVATGVMSLILVWLLSIISKLIGSNLRKNQDETSSNALELINSANLLNRHPNKENALQRFLKLDFRYKFTLSKLSAMAQAPKTAVDAMIAIALLTLAILPTGQTNNLILAAPALAVSFIRVVPYLNSLGQAIMTLRGYAPSVLDALFDVFEKRREINLSSSQQNINNELKNSMEKGLDVIRFSKVKYIEDSQPVTFSLGMKDKLYINGFAGTKKTILLSLLTEELKPFSGNIELPKEWEEHDIQFIGEDLPIFDASLEFNLNFGGDINIKEADISKFGITLPLKKKIKVNTLSKSQRFSINLARAVLAKPKIILVDDILSQLPFDMENELTKTLVSLEQGVLLVGSSKKVPDGFSEIKLST